MIPDQDRAAADHSGVSSELARTSTCPGESLAGTAVLPDYVLPAPKAPVPSSQHPFLLAERFEVTGPLGQGGMGRVFKARDRAIEGRQVALKVLHERYSHDQRFRELFFKEVRNAQQFVSEHVNQVRDTGQLPDGTLFLTMDLVEGESLDRLLGREHVLAVRHALEIARQILLGLQSGHACGLIHRDVKPQNVMLAVRVPKTEHNPFGVGVRLLDFGLADRSSELSEGTIAGTPAYMSPEQARGEKLDARSDLFAVGTVLYEMLSGRRPFEGASLNELFSAVIDMQIEPLVEELPNLPRSVRKILVRALEKDRDSRFQSAGEFLRAIERSGAFHAWGLAPVWMSAALIATTATCVGGGVYFVWETSALRSEVSELQRVVRDKGTALDGSDARIQDLMRENRRLTAKLTEAATAHVKLQSEAKIHAGVADAKVVGKEDVRGALQKQLDTANATINSISLDLDHEKRLRSEAERELKIEKLRNDPRTLTANAVESLLEMIEHDSPLGAEEQFKSSRAQTRFLASGEDGSDFLEPLVAGWSRFAECEATRAQFGRFRRPPLEQVQLLLADAKQRRPAFPARAEAWLEFKPDPQAPAPGRLARLDRALQDLEERLRSAAEALSRDDEASWAELRARGPGQGPEELRRHEGEYGCSHLSEFFGECARSLEATFAPTGRLDVASLAQADFLQRWDEDLCDVQGGALGESERAIRYFAFARRWYTTDAVEALPRFEPPPLPGGAVPAWRRVLALEAELAAAGSAYPIISKGKRVVRREAGGITQWFVEVFKEPLPGDPETTLRTQRLIYDGASREPRLIAPAIDTHYERRGKAWSRKGVAALLLDLRVHGESVRVEPMPELAGTALPPQLGVLDLEHEEFRKSLATEVVPCLVVETGSETTWYSPRYGLVRRIDGATREELVHSSVFRR